MAPKRHPARLNNLETGDCYEVEYRKDPTYFVNCGHESLHGGIALGGCEKIVECRGCDYPGHDTLVVAEEDEA